MPDRVMLIAYRFTMQNKASEDNIIYNYNRKERERERKLNIVCARALMNVYATS